MKFTGHDVRHERMIAHAVRGMLAELRMIDVADILAYARLGHHATIRALVLDAAHLHFAPGFVDLDGETGFALDWDRPPEVVFHLALRPAGLRMHVSTTLSARKATVRLTYLAFDRSGIGAAEGMETIRRAFEDNRLAARDQDGRINRFTTRRIGEAGPG